MKLAKLLSVVLLGSFVMAGANAAPAAKPAQKEDVALKNFNNSVGIRLAAFDRAKVQDKEALVFAHLITNKGKNSTIKSVKWTSLLLLNNQVVLQVPAQVNDLALKPGQTTQINVAVPVELIPQAALPVVTNKQNQFRPVIAAHELSYTNGKRIVVK